jgi:uncharacterized damage-inducible protein DinB
MEMDKSRLLLVADLPGFTPHISRLVSMMNYARATTLDTVKDLNIEQLDERPAGFGNSIAMLLEHFAATEFLFQIYTFEGRYPPDTELPQWLPGLDLGEPRKVIQGKPLEHYLQQLETVRSRTFEEFAKRDDDWLHHEFQWKTSERMTNSYWCWFHVFEDEINHRGQIRLIRKNLTSS